MATPPMKPTLSKQVPSLNPFIASPVFCPSCGDIVHPTATKKPNGTLNEIEYRHVNEKVGCAWKLIPSRIHIQGGSCVPLSKDETEALCKKAYLDSCKGVEGSGDSNGKAEVGALGALAKE